MPRNPPITQVAAVDHRYIDEHSVAARYIENALTAEERAAFEAHMIDCQECTDRVLLAGIFHARQGAAPPARTKVTVKLGAWQVVLIFAISALLLLAIPALLIPILVR